MALEIPEALRNALVEWQRAIVDAGGGELRASAPESLHVTLAFLGHRPEKDVPEIATVVESIVPRAVRFSFESAAVPKPGGRPRLYAAGLRDADDVTKLRSELVAELSDRADFTDEKRAFWPHLTLCRVKSRVKRHVLSGELPQPPRGLGSRFSSPALTLFRSDLQPSGAIHTPVASLALPSE